MVLVAALLSLWLARASDPAVIANELRRACNEFAYGNYHAAAKGLHGLLYPMRLSSDAQVLEARKYYALSKFLLRQTAVAADEFAKILYLDPDYELDAFSVPPPVIELFENTRKKLANELAAIRARRKESLKATAPPPGIVRTIESRVVERSQVATFLPFGIGQFQNGHKGWGTALAITEALLVATNIGAYLWASQLHTYSPQQRAQVQALAAAQYGSLALFGVTWSIGIFHARWHFSPTVIKPPHVREEPLMPPEPPRTMLLNMSVPY